MSTEQPTPPRPRRFGALVLIPIIVVGLVILVSIAPWRKTSFLFINNSSQQVVVQPNGQEWPQFLMEPRDRREVKIRENMIYFLYIDANTVSADVGNGQVIFTDKR